MSSWSAALRIARRDARRARGRSALVLAMIALPVLGVTAVDVLARTYQLSPEQRATREMGAADLVLTDSGVTAVEQSVSVHESWTAVDETPRAARLDLAVPPGSRVLQERESSGRVGAAGRVAQADLHELAYDDPVAAGTYAQVSGRAPDGPREVAVTTALAERLGVEPGSQVELATGPVEVVGTVAPADRVGTTTVVLDPGALGEAAGPLRLLVDVPGPVTWDVVRAANAGGVLVRTRTADVPGAPPPPGGGLDAEAVTGLGLVVGMALLEVVLLAGPAFAVGAKRQERVLALLAATGAERRDLRRTVLAGGLVLGVLGALVGVVAGTATAAAALTVLPRWTTEVPGPFEVRLLEVLAVAALGAATALAAALLPAVLAARQDVLAALTGRRGVRAVSLRVPLVGLVAAAAGAAIALQGARSRSVNTVLAGAALAELGLVATTPAVVGLAGRLGALLPAAPRLALRDAARHRTRTAPAVAAVLAAVAGTVAVSTYLSSVERDDSVHYLPVAAPGAVIASVRTDDDVPDDLVADVSRVLQQGLPGARVIEVHTASAARTTAGDGLLEVGVPPHAECPADPRDRLRPDPRCVDTGYASVLAGDFVVGGPDVAVGTAGVEPATAQVLARGGALVPARSLRPDGTAVLLAHPSGVQEGRPAREVVVPAAALPAGARQQPVVSPPAARALGATVRLVGVVAVPGALPTVQQEDGLRAAVLDVAPGAVLEVERGYRSTYRTGLLVLLAASALLVLGASGIATGLAAADGRADLSTLAAVGASPGVRRLLAGSQSLVTAGLGTLLGTVAGLVPAVGLIRALNAPDSTGYVRPEPFPLVVPWSSIALTLVVVPLLAGLLAAALTRSRLPLVRRAA